MANSVQALVQTYTLVVATDRPLEPAALAVLLEDALLAEGSKFAAVVVIGPDGDVPARNG